MGTTADAMWHKLKTLTLMSPVKYSKQTDHQMIDLPHIGVARSLSWVSEKVVSVYSCEIRGTNGG
jgi:hypothetical protein